MYLAVDHAMLGHLSLQASQNGYVFYLTPLLKKPLDETK